MKFLLTNSRVPRDTKKLVAGVGEKKEEVNSSLICKEVVTDENSNGIQEPELVGKILGFIQGISDEAKRVLADPEISRDTLLTVLSVSATFLHDYRFEVICIYESLGTG